MKTKIITGILSLLLSGISLTAQNLLKNGDFELSPPDGTEISIGWTSSYYPRTAGSITTSTAALEGRCGLYFYTEYDEIEGWCRPFQEIRCTPGTKYKAVSYLRTPRDKGWITGSAAYITLTFKSASGVTIATLESDKLKTKNTDWKLFSIDAVAPEKAALVRYTINLESRKGQSICNADNCSLVIVR